MARESFSVSSSPRGQAGSPQEDHSSSEGQMVIGPPQGSQQLGWQMVPSLGRFFGKEDSYKKEQSFWHHHVVCATKRLTKWLSRKEISDFSIGKFSWSKHSHHCQFQAPN